MLQLKKTEGHIQQLSSVCAGTAFDGPISSKKIKCKETAVENLLKSKYLTNWEVEKISPMCLVFLEQLRPNKVMDGHYVFPSPFLVIFFNKK